jgi:hypothetical protein
MDALLGGFAGSSYLGIAQQYMRGASISTGYGGRILDPSTPPASVLNATDVGREVCALVPVPDPHTVYILFTSNTPNINYCAWHNSATCNGVTFPIAYVPNQAGLLPICSPYLVSDLGCNAYSEGTVASADTVAHEFMESLTDPGLDAWHDKHRYEIADKCSYTYSQCVHLKGGESWQIQQEWSNALGGCEQE